MVKTAPFGVTTCYTHFPDRALVQHYFLTQSCLMLEEVVVHMDEGLPVLALDLQQARKPTVLETNKLRPRVPTGAVHSSNPGPQNTRQYSTRLSELLHRQRAEELQRLPDVWTTLSHGWHDPMLDGDPESPSSPHPPTQALILTTS